MADLVDDASENELYEYLVYSSISSDEITDRPNFFWHYTNINGLIGITKEPSKLCFWFTDKNFLNDTSEGKEILIVYRRVCEKLYKYKQISKEFYDTIKDLVPHNKAAFWVDTKEGRHPMMVDCRLFVCSFSDAEDSLDMWRYYAKEHDGYSLKLSSDIDFSFREDCKKTFDENFFIKAQKVCYDDSNKDDLIRKMLLSIYEKYENCVKESKEVTLANNWIQQAISSYLTKNQLLFKHSCFASENEYRIIVGVNDPSGSASNVIQFRAGNAGLTPYIQLTATIHHLVEIKVGPFQTDPQKHSIESYKRSKKLDCDITYSELPVRF